MVTIKESNPSNTSIKGLGKETIYKPVSLAIKVKALLNKVKTNLRKGRDLNYR